MCQPGEFERGKELGKRGWDVTLVIVGETVNSIPIIGHVKGLYHYARQDSAAGDSAMKSSSRTTAGRCFSTRSPGIKIVKNTGLGHRSERHLRDGGAGGFLPLTCS